MSDLSCDTARLRLQAGDDLTAVETTLIEEHLARCAACSAFREDQHRLDNLVSASLDSLEIPPVAAQVRARLAARAVPASTRRRHLLPRSWLAA
ncbi:MAG: hypothetical protein M3Z66_03410, partial [Chloroflexota bacterium]|nr:hypothetical protein [Chloroflexota bacterium]